MTQRIPLLLLAVALGCHTAPGKDWVGPPTPRRPGQLLTVDSYAHPYAWEAYTIVVVESFDPGWAIEAIRYREGSQLRYYRLAAGSTRPATYIDSVQVYQLSSSDWQSLADSVRLLDLWNVRDLNEGGIDGNTQWITVVEGTRRLALRAWSPAAALPEDGATRIVRFGDHLKALLRRVQARPRPLQPNNRMKRGVRQGTRQSI